MNVNIPDEYLDHVTTQISKALMSVGDVDGRLNFDAIATRVNSSISREVENTLTNIFVMKYREEYFKKLNQKYEPLISVLAKEAAEKDVSSLWTPTSEKSTCTTCERKSLNELPPIVELGMSIRTMNTLHSVGIRTLGELADYDEVTLLKLPNVGRRMLNEIKQQLANAGLSLRGRHAK